MTRKRWRAASAAAQRVEGAEQLGRADAGLAREHAERQRLGLDRVGGDQVELGAVAGRDRGGLADVRRVDELAEHAGGAALGQRQALAQLQRRGLVGDAEREQLRSSARLPPASSARSASSPQLALDPLRAWRP